MRFLHPPNLRRFIIVLWLLIAAAMTAALIFPIRFGALRLFIVCGWLMLWLLTTWLGWKWRPVRMTQLMIAVAAGFFILGPGRPLDVSSLQRDYLAALISYKNVPYVWGGECRRGIDCSGLVRRGLIDAALMQGLSTLNPRGVRSALELWFFDSSAKAMGEEYRSRSTLLFGTNSLNEADYSRLQPGDFAVTTSGAHTLAYLGNRQWIQADPGAWKVIVETAPSRNAWFSQPMKIMRWSLLSDGAID